MASRTMGNRATMGERGAARQQASMLDARRGELDDGWTNPPRYEDK